MNSLRAPDKARGGAIQRCLRSVIIVSSYRQLLGWGILTIVLIAASCNNASHEESSKLDTESESEILPASLPPETAEVLVTYSDGQTATYTTGNSQQIMTAVADNHISLDEYQQAFDIFQQCVHDSGRDFYSVSTDPDTGLINYLTRDRDLDIVDECYYKHFDLISTRFQTTNPAVLAKYRREEEESFAASHRPCLENNGVAIPEGTKTLNDAPELIQKWVDLIRAGAC